MGLQIEYSKEFSDVVKRYAKAFYFTFKPFGYTVKDLESEGFLFYVKYKHAENPEENIKIFHTYILRRFLSKKRRLERKAIPYQNVNSEEIEQDFFVNIEDKGIHHETLIDLYDAFGKAFPEVENPSYYVRKILGLINGEGGLDIREVRRFRSLARRKAVLNGHFNEGDKPVYCGNLYAKQYMQSFLN